MIEVLFAFANHSFFWLWLAILICGAVALFGRCLPTPIGRSIFASAFLLMISGMIMLTLIALIVATSVIAQTPIAWPFKLLLALFLVFPTKVLEQLFLAGIGFRGLEKMQRRGIATGQGLLPRPLNQLAAFLIVSTVLVSFLGFFVEMIYELWGPLKILPFCGLGGFIVAVVALLRGLLQKSARTTGRRS